MSSLFYKRSALSLVALAAVLSLSACGEKKEVRPQHQSGPLQEEPKNTTTTVDESTSENESTGQPADLPTNPNADTAREPSIPIPAPKTNADPNIPIPAPGSESAGERPLPPPVAPPTAPRPPKLDDANKNYDPKNPANVENDRLIKRYTGLKDQDGLAYTGSAPDSLLTYLRQRSEAPGVDAQTKKRNLTAARQVLSARINRSHGDVVISLDLMENGRSKAYFLEGRREEGRVTKLSLAESNGAQNIEGTLKCLDADGGCENSTVKLLIGPRGSRAVVRIVFRDSSADLHVKFPSQRSGNPEYEAMRNFWLNSKDKAHTNFRLKDAYLNSFAVVNGRSGFDLQIVGQNKQMIVFAGPLLAPEKSTKINIRADRSIDMADGNLFDYDLANTISEARVINNNGLGQIRLALKMRQRNGYEQDHFMLTIKRVIEPILPLNEENIL